MLYGVHHGKFAGSGHYTFHVFHPNRDGGTRGGGNNSVGVSPLPLPTNSPIIESSRSSPLQRIG